ncbi:MAG: hypothetical protein HYZ50_05965 [Deltaproteobacteria bacterium]|nr:hypothetical protein [Deltaproteobacteria bacterium]
MTSTSGNDVIKDGAGTDACTGKTQVSCKM